MQTRIYRSLLFVPGSRPEWLKKVKRFGPDAYVIDLEDAVAPDEKTIARDYTAEAIPQLAEDGSGVFVRINDLSTPYWLDDLKAIAVPGLTGVSLPKAARPEDVQTVDNVLTALERNNDMPLGEIDIQPLIESAHGISNGPALLSASPRLRSAWAGVARNGDVNRELQSQFQLDGRDSLYLRSKLLVDIRGAGIKFPISGTWVDLQDHDGLRRYAQENRMLGYVGMYVIHPSHVEIVNEVFTPTREEFESYRRVLEAMDEAQRLGNGSAQLDGAMIDIAMAEHAKAMFDAYGVFEQEVLGMENR